MTNYPTGFCFQAIQVTLPRVNDYEMKTIIALLIVSFSLPSFAQMNTKEVINPRIRVIIDNDFGGDPDGLFALAHHLLSPTVEVNGIIGSIQYSDGFYGYLGNSQHSAKMATELLEVMGMNKKYIVIEGANNPLADTLKAKETESARLIINEAMRDDTKMPLYVVCGAGLTNIATALMIEPKIAERITLVWIGGTEYEGLATPPPGAGYNWEYNTGIDIKASQVVFNHSNVNIWQVPRNAYRQALISYAELIYKVKDKGTTGKYLVERLDDLMKRANKNLGEAYALGDSPLVLLTALQSSWEIDPSSSKYATRKAPTVDKNGMFHKNPEGREIRVYDELDIRLMFEDFFAKLALFEENND